MNFLELCEELGERVNGHPLVFESVSLKRRGNEYEVPDPARRKVIRAVQNAFSMIVNYSQHWEFFAFEGKLLTLQAGKGQYTPNKYDSFDGEGLYLVRETGAARYPVAVYPYDFWLELNSAVSPQSGLPRALIPTPQKDWIFWPTPTENLTLYGKAQLLSAKLEYAFDEPPWDSQHHGIIVDLAEKVYQSRADSREEIVQQLAVASLNSDLSVKMVDFFKLYLPNFHR